MQGDSFVLDLRIERIQSEDAAEELLREIQALVEQSESQVTGYAIREADSFSEPEREEPKK